MASRPAREHTPITMSTTQATGDATPQVSAGDLSYDVFINEPPPQDGVLPNGERKLFSPQASTLIYGREDAVLTDPAMTTDQARALGDWVAAKGRNLTDIFVTHGHGDHWFAAGLLAERFGARVVASEGTIAQMHVAVASRPLLWDKLYDGIHGGIPPAAVTAVTVPNNRFTLEGHELVIVEVGSTDVDDSTVLHVPDLELVVAGDVIYNGVHMYLAQPAIVGGFGPWRAAIDTVAALEPRHIVAGHQNRELDDDAVRQIAQTRQYLDDAEELLRTASSAVDFFDAKLERYPAHLGRTVLWVSAQTLYGVRDRPAADLRQIVLGSWL
jgi:glyoxylase-like metal-dependent hydrolase (beta-lactamase superfamily II)